MADIFISYSSKDHEQAEQLSELLISAGLSVWIDKQGIQAASSWSEEIVHGIDSCSVFIIILSPNSTQSHNVVKEVSLASEKRKKILPLDLEPVEIPPSMQYALAGIQRTPMTNIDAIIRAVGKLGFEAKQAPSIKIVKETDSRKSLMILPFEDLSPTADNGWFADGLASEMISKLSNIKSLRLIDWNSSKLFKERRAKTTDVAREFSVRYFIEGQVRKFGDQIKISVTLLDIETGDHLWQDSLRGEMKDIFDIQDEVAEKVAEGLKVHLATEEKEKLGRRSTHNIEAYELYMKAREYYQRHTKADYERAITLYEDAIRIEPLYITAHMEIAHACIELYRTYAKEPRFIERIQLAADRIYQIEGETAEYLMIMSSLARSTGSLDKALELAKRAVSADPKLAVGYSALAFAYQHFGMLPEAANAREQNVVLNSNNLSAHFNLMVVLSELGDAERITKAADRALPVFTRHLRLTPDDTTAKVQYAFVLQMAGKVSEAVDFARLLISDDGVDAGALYNLACLFAVCNDPERTINALRASIGKGLRDIEHINHDPDLDLIRNTAEFEELIKELKEKITSEQTLTTND